MITVYMLAYDEDGLLQYRFTMQAATWKQAHNLVLECINIFYRIEYQYKLQHV